MTDDNAFRKKAVAGAGWVAIDRWSNRFMSLIVLTVLSRLLSPTDFGTVAIATAFLTFVGVFAEQGFARALVQRQELHQNYPSTSFWTSFISSIVLAGLMVALAPLIAPVFGGSSELTHVLQAMSIGLVLNAISSTPAALLERDFRFKALAIRRLLGTILGGVGAIVAAFAGLGVWSLVLQTLIAALVGLVALWAASRWRPSFVMDFTALKNLWSVGANIMGIELVGVANSHADRLLIGAVLSPEAVGYYFLAIRVVGIMVDLFSSVFSGASLATFSRLQTDPERLRAWFYKLTSMSSTTAIPVFALAALTAPVLLPFAFGPQWDASVTLFQILCMLGALNAVAYFDRTVLIAVGRARSAFLLTLGQTIFGTILIVFAVPFGVTAVAIAVTARQYLYWPMRLYTLRRNLGISASRYWLQWLKPFLISIVAGGVCVGINLLTPSLVMTGPIIFVILNTLVFGGLYALGVWIFNRGYYRDIGRILRRSL